MAEPALAKSSWDRAYLFKQARSILIPFAFIMMLVVIVIPLPTVLMDLLLVANLTIAAIVLLTVVYMEKPLDFSVFPSLLLGTTLFRLGLNIATTRLILTADANSAEEAMGVAGQVIMSFGQLVAGSNPIVGTVIFSILVIVQFVVITKGATRISEVAARFTLDAMPGKQMAIDADLTAGLIDEADARTRRDKITREADFYGAMDGASKFVRGDSIASIIITVINLLGGFAIGAIYKGWSPMETVSVFTLLTIGDGLVSQIPSFIIAIASGLIVARSGSEEDFGTELSGQLASRPKALYMTAGFLTVMSLTGLPFLPMIVCAIGVATVGFFVSQGLSNTETQRILDAQQASEVTAPEGPQVDDLLKIDLLELELGYALVPLVNQGEGGDLLERISMIRRQLAVELGLVLPPVRIRDNAQINPNTYRVKIRGATIAEGMTYPKKWMAMDAGLATGEIEGLAMKEPAFGLEAWWIEEEQRSRAESLGYTVVDAISVLMTHFTEVVKTYGDEMITREEVNNLISNARDRAPKLIEEVIPDKVKPNLLQKVLQALLREQVPIRDLELIIETLGDWVTHTQDADVLVEYVRNALRRTISARYTTQNEQGEQRLYCVTVDPQMEDVISGYIDRSGSGTTITMPPSVASRVTDAVLSAIQPLVNAGRPPVVLTSPQIRGPLRQLLEPHMANLAVLGYNEIPQGLDVESLSLVQLKDTHAAKGLATSVAGGATATGVPAGVI